MSTFRRDVSRDVVNYFGDGFDRDKIKILMDFRVVFEIKCYDTVRRELSESIWRFGRNSRSENWTIFKCSSTMFKRQVIVRRNVFEIPLFGRSNIYIYTHRLASRWQRYNDGSSLIKEADRIDIPVQDRANASLSMALVSRARSTYQVRDWTARMRLRIPSRWSLDISWPGIDRHN